jgi:hypothetical protein
MSMSIVRAKTEVAARGASRPQIPESFKPKAPSPTPAVTIPESATENIARVPQSITEGQP